MRHAWPQRAAVWLFPVHCSRQSTKQVLSTVESGHVWHAEWHWSMHTLFAVEDLKPSLQDAPHLFRHLFVGERRVVCRRRQVG